MSALVLKGKGKGPLTVKSSCEQLWGCGAHLALLAKGADVCPQTVFPGHVGSMTKPLLEKPEQCTETPFTFLLERYLFIYLHFFGMLLNC